MVEVVFCESATGSLQLAQDFGRGAYPGGATAVFLSGPSAEAADLERARRKVDAKLRQEWDQGKPMDGSTDDIYSFPLGLSVGDISEEVPGPRRARELERLTGRGSLEAGAAVESAGRDLREVRRRSAAGEPVRIWYSEQPDEMCGLYWMLMQLQGMGPVSMVRLPLLEQCTAGSGQDKAVYRSSWGEVAPGEWKHLAGLEKRAAPMAVQAAAQHWQRLRRENAPLRAVVNGRLVSVAEDFYDGFILSELCGMDEDFLEARLIGRVMSAYQLGVSDGFLAGRIQALIGAGTLSEVSPASGGDPAFRRLLRKR